jgi:hypothetical protein
VISPQLVWSETSYVFAGSSSFFGLCAPPARLGAGCSTSVPQAAPPLRAVRSGLASAPDSASSSPQAASATAAAHSTKVRVRNTAF